MNAQPLANSALDDKQLLKLLAELKRIRSKVKKTQKTCLEVWRPHIHWRGFKPSAQNMAAYIGLRRQDLRPVQAQLAAIGLSSLGRTEEHVLANLEAVIQALKALTGERPETKKIQTTANAFAKTAAHLNKLTKRLLGTAPKNRTVRIMVTLPSEAATDYEFVRELVKRGMDSARINCAHDTPESWRKMAAFIRQAEKETGRSCKILMDLAGQKLRTGPVAFDHGVVRIKPRRDSRGSFLESATVVLDASGAPGRESIKDVLGNRLPARLSVDPAWLKRVKKGDKIQLADLRGKAVTLIVEERLSKLEVLASSRNSAYLEEGSVLRHADAECKVGAMIAPPVGILLRIGDTLQLTRKPLPGEPAKIDEANGRLIPAHISCAEPAIFSCLKKGQRVLIDDGHICAEVAELNDEGALLKITRARSQGSKLAPEKGLNFPETDIDLPALTEKDKEDLDCIVKHADIVGYSFVQSGEDMQLLIDELAKRGADKLGIVAKIETRRALKNLPEIIIRGAGSHPFGVMIARGDLAVELGYEQLAETQEEIMWLCEAAQVPVIWATQVLEGLVKQNMLTRAEVTDAAMAERAECIMLNKGPFVLDAIAVLDIIVASMHSHQKKKSSQMRALHW